MKSKIHRSSLDAFVDRVKGSNNVPFEGIVRQMWYNIGWPVDSIVYVLTQLNKHGYSYPTDIQYIKRVLRK